MKKYLVSLLAFILAIAMMTPAAATLGEGETDGYGYDDPIAADYDFVCWIDKDGTRYYPGDKIYVDHEVKLTPLMAPKTDKDDHTVRTIRAAFQALIRVLGKAFGFFKTMEDFNAAP